MALPEEIRKKTAQEVSRMESEGATDEEIDGFLSAVKAKYETAPAVPPTPRPEAAQVPGVSEEALSMLPPDIRAVVQRSFSESPEEGVEVLRKIAPFAAGGLASLIPIPGLGPAAALGVQGALGGAAALGTEAALEGELPSPGEAAAEIGGGAAFGPFAKLFGGALKRLGKSGLIQAFKISKMRPELAHTPQGELVEELVKKHGGITGSRAAIEKSMEETGQKLSSRYNALLDGAEGRKIADAEVAYNIALKDVDKLPGFDAIQKNKMRKIILDKLDAEKADRRITKSGYSKMRDIHDMKVAASKEIDFGDPDKTVKSAANDLLRVRLNEQAKGVSKAYDELSDEAANTFYKFKDFVKESGQQAQRRLGALEMMLSAPPLIAAFSKPELILPAAAPLAILATRKMPSVATQAMRLGGAAEEAAKLRALPAIAGAEALEEEDEARFQNLPPPLVEILRSGERKRREMETRGVR